MTVETPSTQEEERPAGASSHTDDNWCGRWLAHEPPDDRSAQARAAEKDTPRCSDAAELSAVLAFLWSCAHLSLSQQCCRVYIIS